MRVSMRNLAAILCLMVGVVTLPGRGVEAAYPERPLRIIVPFPPGGGTDLISRTLGAAMAQELGQPVVIENKPGAGTVVGTALAANSPPDGYTLVMATFAHAVNPSLKPSLPYDTFKS